MSCVTCQPGRWRVAGVFFSFWCGGDAQPVAKRYRLALWGWESLSKEHFRPVNNNLSNTDSVRWWKVETTRTESESLDKKVNRKTESHLIWRTIVWITRLFLAVLRSTPLLTHGRSTSQPATVNYCGRCQWTWANAWLRRRSFPSTRLSGGDFRANLEKHFFCITWRMKAYALKCLCFFSSKNKFLVLPDWVASRSWIKKKTHVSSSAARFIFT